MSSQPLTLSTLILPTFTKGLSTLTHILNQAESHAHSQGLDPDTIYPQSRLIDDMNPLTFQVHNATRTVRLTLGRLVRQEPDEADPEWAHDQLQTFADFRDRIDMARALLLQAAEAGEEIDSRAGEGYQL